MFTEFAPNDDDPDTNPSTLARRVADTLRKNLSEEQFDQTWLSFHLLPEEWNHGIRQTPSDPDAPVYAPLKPKPHLRSGGAMAVSERNDFADLSKTPSISRRLV